MKPILTILVFIAGVTFAQTKFEEVPAWAKEAVWYQIFPERFSNGDTNNDPTPEDLDGAWPYFIPDGWQIHPWGSDWYKLQPWEGKTEKDFYWNAGIRRYGGDIQGIINKLDYLKSLGVTALYLNPIFESPSLHKYDATMYHHVDNNFGPDPKADKIILQSEDPADPSTWKWTSADQLFLDLINETHKRGMKIIIDGVFNHTGSQFWAFQDVVTNQQKSTFKDWFIINRWDDPSTSENEFEYAGWYGVKDLPEIREDENGIVSGPREHIRAIVKRWMDPNGDGDPSDGVDGWRLDVAEMVNHNFWIEFRKWVRKINPEAYTVGEVWWEDWQNYKMFNAKPWLNGDQFDAVMNYRSTRALKDFVVNKNEPIGTQAFIDTLNNIMSNYGENYYAMMNLLGSHDTERLASMIVNPDLWYDHYGNPSQNKDFLVRKPNDEERLKQMLMVLFQFTLPGAPHIYYGDEAGMWGGDDPDCRKPMVWAELDYETETTHPFGKPRPNDKVKFEQNLFALYKKIAAIRNQNKALSFGSLTFFIIDKQKKILAYAREYNGEKVYIIANNNPNPNSIVLDNSVFLKGKDVFCDLLNGKNFAQKKSKFNLELSPYQLMILK